MSEFTGGPDAAPYGPVGGSQFWASAQADATTNRPSWRNRSLWLVAAILGPVAWAVSLASPAQGSAVRLCMAAAAVAAVGLLPGQQGRGWVVVALAVTGFSDEVATLVAAQQPRGSGIVVAVLAGLQALAAVVALLLERVSGSATEAAERAEYDAYTDYVEAYQAYQAYATHYGQYPIGHDGEHAHGQARADAAAPAQARETSDSWTQLQARYSQYGASDAAAHAGAGARTASPATRPEPPIGMPTAHPVDRAEMRMADRQVDVERSAFSSGE